MPELLLIYDKQCPFCDHYCRLVRIRAAVGTLANLTYGADRRHPA
jgi:predicted DCC family thiol-disulfide oxidoreductase YuxK